jgi:hypothetical protein
MYSDQSPKGEELEKLQTTLLVSTVFPQKDSSEEFLEVATIRSPYTFDIENSQKSTRYRAASRVIIISCKYLSAYHLHVCCRNNATCRQGLF